MDCLIRPLRDEDYLGIHAINEELMPGRAGSVEGYRADDQATRARWFRERWVGQSPAGELLGHAVLTQDRYFPNGTEYSCNVWVKPAWQRKGLGSRFLRQIEARYQEQGGRLLRCPVYDDKPEGLIFLEKNGFAEGYRTIRSELDLSRFDESAHVVALERVEKAAIRIVPLRELVQLDPHARQKVYELDCRILKDIPMPAGFTARSYEDFWASVDRDCPELDSYFVAHFEDRFVGLHLIFRPKGTTWFLNAMTGVDPEFRTLGIATALKLHGVRFARAQGADLIWTWNHALNTRVLRLNQKFGFARRQSLIFMERV